MKQPASVLLLTAALAGCATSPGGDPMQFNTGIKANKTISVEVFNARSNRDEVVPVRVYLPPTPSPAKPALVFMGHCTGQLVPIHKHLIATMLEKGAVVAEVATMEARGRPSQLCDENRFDTGNLRSEEAFRARDALAALGLADPKNVAVYGSSHGGYTLSWVIYGAAANNYSTSPPFRAAVGIYPGCRPFRTPEAIVKTPTLLMLGDRDNWTPVAPCAEMLRVTRGGEPLEMIVFPNATHSWDVNRPGRNSVTTSGEPTYLEYNDAVTRESFAKTMEFFSRYLDF